MNLMALIMSNVVNNFCRQFLKVFLCVSRSPKHPVCISLDLYLVFIVSKESVVVKVSGPDDVLAGVFRYECSVRGSM